MLVGTVVILSFLLLHWWGSQLMHTLFLHRYASHQSFRLSRARERVFYLLTYLFQGSSFLVPRAYAHLHRAHHAYADSEKDPHSPHVSKNVFAMMWKTKRLYSDLRRRTVEPEVGARGYVPEWPALDRLGSNYLSRVAWGTGYTLVYLAFAPHWVFFLLLPIHYLMGPIQGAIVNWAGHKYGYRNFETPDQARNVLRWDVITLGELFQNNHHHDPRALDFGSARFEWDPTHAVIRALAACGVIEPRRPSRRSNSSKQATTPATNQTTAALNALV